MFKIQGKSKTGILQCLIYHAFEHVEKCEDAPPRDVKRNEALKC